MFGDSRLEQLKSQSESCARNGEFRSDWAVRGGAGVVPQVFKRTQEVDPVIALESSREQPDYLCDPPATQAEPSNLAIRH